MANQKQGAQSDGEQTDQPARWVIDGAGRLHDGPNLQPFIDDVVDGPVLLSESAILR